MGYSKISVCQYFGKSKQAYYQSNDRFSLAMAREEDMIRCAMDIKSEYPGIGSGKLHLIIKDMFPYVKIYGRDKFHLLLKRCGLINKKQGGRSTTNSNHHFRIHKFLAKGFEPTAINQLWVSDITYIALDQDSSYLHLVTDVYSRKIVGWCLSPTLEAKYSIMALQKALDGCPEGTDFSKLMHHSDRGIQYCSNAYVHLLRSKEIQISMTQDGNPLDNAIAERVNGILKGEALEHFPLFKNLKEATERVEKTISFYNNIRPHMSLNMNTPESIYSGRKKKEKTERKEQKQREKQYLCQEAKETSVSA